MPNRLQIVYKVFGKMSYLCPKNMYRMISLKSFILFASSLTCSNLSAQFIPSDDGFPPVGPGWEPGAWVGDTIISKPVIGSGITINSPSHPVVNTITAVYANDVIFILSDVAISFTYEVLDDVANTILCANTTLSPTVPACIYLPSLPIGRYTLLLYINNECLEGEFEKE